MMTPVMTPVKALYRSWAIPCTGKQVYAPQHRAERLAKIREPGVHRRAEFYYQQLDALRSQNVVRSLHHHRAQSTGLLRPLGAYRIPPETGLLPSENGILVNWESGFTHEDKPT